MTDKVPFKIVPVDIRENAGSTKGAMKMFLVEEERYQEPDMRCSARFDKETVQSCPQLRLRMGEGMVPEYTCNKFSQSIPDTLGICDPCREMMLYRIEYEKKECIDTLNRKKRAKKSRQKALNGARHGMKKYIYDPVLRCVRQRTVEELKFIRFRPEKDKKIKTILKEKNAEEQRSIQKEG